MIPAVTIVTDNGRPFRSVRFEHFITAHPELRPHEAIAWNRPLDVHLGRAEVPGRTGATSETKRYREAVGEILTPSASMLMERDDWGA